MRKRIARQRAPTCAGGLLGAASHVGVDDLRDHVVGFRQLLTDILSVHADDPRPIVVVVDNFRIHAAQAVQAWLRSQRRLIRLYFLPTYAPRLNPIERLWHHVRRNVTDNYFFRVMPRLMRALEAFLSELAHAPAVVRRIIA